MIDFPDELNITAAAYATQNGFTTILECLLDCGTQINSDEKTGRLNILDASYGYFKTGENSLKAIIQFCTKDKEFATPNVKEVRSEKFNVSGPKHFTYNLGYSINYMLWNCI